MKEAVETIQEYFKGQIGNQHMVGLQRGETVAELVRAILA